MPFDQDNIFKIESAEKLHWIMQVVELCMLFDCDSLERQSAAVKVSAVAN